MKRNPVNWKRRTALQCGKVVLDYLYTIDKQSLRDVVKRLVSYMEAEEIGEAVKYQDCQEEIERLERVIDALNDQAERDKRARDKSIWATYLKAAQNTIADQKKQIQRLRDDGFDDNARDETIKLGFTQDEEGDFNLFDVETGRAIAGLRSVEVSHALNSGCIIKLEAYAHDNEKNKFGMQK